MLKVVLSYKCLKKAQCQKKLIETLLGLFYKEKNSYKQKDKIRKQKPLFSVHTSRYLLKHKAVECCMLTFFYIRRALTIV